ncbi:hypothetical protein ABEV54_17365 [Peribacillus psychrosaccharolyticus]|uniref:hypothetical protein n=1 Tax=Peribacillus psychrosaccharolyticus TaxID=1407 RepID=UPI003D299C25
MRKSWIWAAGIMVGMILIFFIGLEIGKSRAVVTLNSKKVDAVALEKEVEKSKVKIDELKVAILTLENEKDTAEAEAAEMVDEADVVYALIESKDEIEAQLSEVTGLLKKEEQSLKDMKSRVKEKEGELASLSGAVKQAKGKPRTLQAGYYTVGQDLPEGRYKATPIGEGSNFFVNEGMTVNTILGRDGEASYTFSVSEGDVIQTEAAVKLTPLEGE